MFLLVTAGANAELLVVQARIEGIGCASCLESLPERLKRIRGVEDVKVDPQKSTVEVRLAPGNRARLAAIRDQIQQDGTKALEFTLDASGELAKEGDEWVFRVEPQVFTVKAARGLTPGVKRLGGVVRQTAANPMIIELTSQ